MHDTPPTGHITCPHCNNGHIPTIKTVQSVQNRLLTLGYRKSDVTAGAGVDPAIWTRCVPRPVAQSSWSKLWNYMQELLAVEDKS